MRRLDDHRHGFAAMMRFARAASAAVGAALVLAVAPSACAQVWEPPRRRPRGLAPTSICGARIISRAIGS